MSIVILNIGMLVCAYMTQAGQEYDAIRAILPAGFGPYSLVFLSFTCTEKPDCETECTTLKNHNYSLEEGTATNTLTYWDNKDNTNKTISWNVQLVKDGTGKLLRDTFEIKKEIPGSPSVTIRRKVLFTDWETCMILGDPSGTGNDKRCELWYNVDFVNKKGISGCHEAYDKLCPKRLEAFKPDVCMKHGYYYAKD